MTSPLPKSPLAVRQAARDLRLRQTPTERMLWQALRNRGFFRRKFRRQHPIGSFVLDFYCMDASLAVEIDGPIHDNQGTEDDARQEAIEELGVRFVRIPTAIVVNDIEAALKTIEGALTDCPSPAAAGEGSGVRA